MKTILTFLMLLALCATGLAQEITPIVPAENGGEFIVNNYGTILSTILAILALFLRVAPTKGNYDIIHTIIRVLRMVDKFIPNRRKNKDNPEKDLFTVTVETSNDI